MKKLLNLLAASLIIIASCLHLNAQVIRTIGGVNAPGYTGDGGLSINASFGAVSGIITATDGTIYMTDAVNNTIRKISTNLTISTIAGTPGIAGYNGDGGPAAAALLHSPMGIAIDATGNLYVADNGNGVIRRIDAAGNISTVAGLTGVGLAFSNTGNLYVADGISRVWLMTPDGTVQLFAGTGITGYAGDDAAATLATLNAPQGVASDLLGNIYIADAQNNVVRKVNTAGIITTIAGTGTAGYNGDNLSAVTAMLNTPVMLRSDAAGSIFIADKGNNRIRKIDHNGTITTVCGAGTAAYLGDGGSAATASLNAPTDFVYNNNGNLLIADNGNLVIREVLFTGNTAMNLGWATSFCAGTMVNFFPVTNNALYAVAYRWTVNGTATEATDANFITNTLNNGDEVRCAIIDPFKGFVLDSNAYTVTTVVANVTPAISISAGTGTIPAGETEVVFAASAENGGANPAYQWTLNNAAIAGATSNTYTSEFLADGAHINCILTSDANCVTINDVPSNTLTAALVTIQFQHMPGGIINIAPNPNNGNFVMKGETGLDLNINFNYWITDIMGHVVYQNTAALSHGAFALPVRLDDKIAAGMYSLTLAPDNQKITVEFMIAK